MSPASAAGLIVVITACILAIVVTVALVRRYLMPPPVKTATGPPGPKGNPGASITRITTDGAGTLTFYFSDGKTCGVKLPEYPPVDVEPSQPEGERLTASPMEAQLLQYDPKPGHEPINCSCHNVPLRAGQRILWWPNEDGTVVKFCDKSEQYQQFLKAARDLAASQ